MREVDAPNRYPWESDGFARELTNANRNIDDGRCSGSVMRVPPPLPPLQPPYTKPVALNAALPKVYAVIVLYSVCGVFSPRTPMSL